MVLATIRMRIPAQKHDEVLRILKAIAERSAVQPGCLSCHIYRNGAEDDVFLFEQRWDNQGNLDRHLQSDEYRQLLLVLEMAILQPEVRFDTISGSTGIETIERARGAMVGP